MLRAGQSARSGLLSRLVRLGGSSKTAEKRAYTFQEENTRSARQCDRCEDVDWGLVEVLQSRGSAKRLGEISARV
jgi:hypothetical protein